GGNFVLAFVYAGLAGAVASVLLGLPAIRAKGLMFTVTTLSFALIVPAWLLSQPWMFGDGVIPKQPAPFGLSLATGRSYYYFALVILLVAMLIARNIRRSGMGRVLVAVRDNEENARAFTVNAGLAKVKGFVLAGFIAGLGGALYTHSLSSVGNST